MGIFLLSHDIKCLKNIIFYYIFYLNIIFNKNYNLLSYNDCYILFIKHYLHYFIDDLLSSYSSYIYIYYDLYNVLFNDRLKFVGFFNSQQFSHKNNI